MSNKIVRTLSQPSNRANQRDNKEKKVVFKGVLDNPFRILWPSIPVNLQNSILAYITEKLDGAATYHFNCSSINRRRKRATKVLNETEKRKRTKVDAGLGNESYLPSSSHSIYDSSTNAPNTRHSADTIKSDILNAQQSPLLLKHMTYGINEVTKKLETQIHNFHLLQVVDVPEPSLPLKYVFVCRSDVDPPLLIDHLPHLVAAYNSNCLRDPIKLVTLPQGAELLLAQNLGIRRVTVIAIDINYNDQHLASMLESVPTLTASWLLQPNASTSLIPTHIKHVRTTAPRDMKAAKDLRVQQKLDAKKKKLQNDAGARG